MGLIKGKQIAAGTIATDRLVEGSQFLQNDGDGFPMTVNADLGNNRIVNLAPGIAGTDAANVNQVNAAQGGLDPKDSSDAATTAALTTWIAAGSGVGKTLTSPDNLTANNDFDTYTVAVGDRVLVKDGGPNATPAIDNGIYEVTQIADGAANPTILTRATDFDNDSEVTTGAFTLVINGTLNGGTGWIVTTPDPIVVDTTAINWTLFSVSPGILAGAGLVQNGNTIDVNPGNGISLVAPTADAVNVDTAAIAGENLEDDGADNLRIAGSAAGAGLTGAGGAGPLQVGAGDGITVGANDVQVNATAIAGTGLENDGSNNLRIAAAAAGDGLIGGGGAALEVNDDGTTIAITTDQVHIATGAAGNGLTGGGLATPLAVGGGNGIVANANDVAVEPNITTSPTQPRPSVAVDAGGLWAASKVTSNKNQTPAPTAGDEASTTITITDVPVGYVWVCVNGIKYLVGNAVKTLAAYFSADGGVTAKAFNDIASGDTLYWNGIICGFDLAADDTVSLEYDAV